MIYAVENGDYAVTDHVPRRLDAPENLVQSLRLLLTLPRQGYYPRPVGGVGGCGADLLPDELLALGRRAVCDVPMKFNGGQVSTSIFIFIDFSVWKPLVI